MNFRQVGYFNFLKRNYDIIIGFLIFILYRYLLTYILWHGRLVPPEPDDSYFYLASAKYFFSPQNFEEFRLILYSAWLNFLTILTGLSLEKAYELNFYIGPIFLFAAIAYFFKKLELSQKDKLILFIIIALYNGSGAYHGFYWVVPTFYQLVFLFILFGFLISKELPSKSVLFLTSLIFIFMHPSSIAFAPIFLIYPLIIYILARKQFLASFRNSLNVSVMISFAYVIYFLLGRQFPSGQSPESFAAFSSYFKNFISGNFNLGSLSVVRREYFDILFFHPISVVGALLILGLSFYGRQFKVLALFIASIILVLALSLFPYGFRSLGILWPLTFIVIGYVFILVKNFVYTKLPKGKIFPYILLIVFALMATLFNLVWLKSQNIGKNYSWDRNCPSKLKTDHVFFDNLEVYHAFLLYGSEKDNAKLPEDPKEIEKFRKPVYFVTSKSQVQQEERLSKIEIFLTNLITRRKSPPKISLPESFWTGGSQSIEKSEILAEGNGIFLNYYLDCGHFQVYELIVK